MKKVSETGGIVKDYDYDIGDNRILFKLTVNSAVQMNTTYDYDELSRLKYVKENNVTQTTYVYNVNGNRESLAYSNGISTAYAYNLANLVTDVQNKKSSAVQSSYAYTYYFDGNQRTKTDHTGRVTTKTTHIWDGDNIAAELSGNSIAATYLRGLNLIYSQKSGSKAYYSFNAHGDVVQLTNASGNVSKDYRYDAFGNEYGQDVNDTNPWRYSGEYLDLKTNAYYLRSRYYQPTTGRFLAEDTYWNPRNMVCGSKNSSAPNIHAIMQSSNLYVFALNNPLRWIDPSGLKIELSSIATETEKEQYERAIEYLMTSDTAATLIKALKDSPKTITIVFNSRLDDRANLYDPNVREINWNPLAGLVLSRNNRNVMSAAMALVHEMGHALQHLDNMFISYTNITVTIRSKMEEDNLKRHETPIAEELGEYHRKSYSDSSGLREMNNSTEWGRLIIPGSAWNPLNWFKPMVLVNQNPWLPE